MFRTREEHVPEASHIGIRGFSNFFATVNLLKTYAYKMAYRRALNLLPRGKQCMFSVFQKPPMGISQTLRFHINNQCSRTRNLHTATPLMVAKLLSVEELFAMRSLQGYLKKMETEYSECLRVVNSSETREQYSEDELRAKRTKASLLAPLIQSIRELEAKQKDVAETEMLMKG